MALPSALYLFDQSVPVLVVLAHIHPLLVEKLALLWNQQNVTHKLTHWKREALSEANLSVIQGENNPPADS